eukprot:SAG31_NODE_25712_length_456_cov_0.599440_2_plen_43_part_01
MISLSRAELQRGFSLSAGKANDLAKAAACLGRPLFSQNHSSQQ